MMAPVAVVHLARPPWRWVSAAIAGAGLAVLPLHAHNPAMADTQPTTESPATDAEAFARWLDAFRLRARAAGVSQATIDQALGTLAPAAPVLRAAANQPEFDTPIWDYLARLVSDQRIAHGQAELAARDGLLRAIETVYGVDRHILCAIWGIESAYGTRQGDQPIIAALVTLATGSARASFGEAQALAALRIIDRGELGADDLIGSWAGAFGHTQFIPTTYLAHAVDFDGDGRRDVRSSAADGLASAANYLVASGWRKAEPWGFEVRLPDGLDLARLAEDWRPLPVWAGLGVVAANAGLWTGREAWAGVDARLLLPAGLGGPAFLLMANYSAILRYNRSNAYALAVGHLADRLAGGAAFVGAWPTGEPPLSRDDRMALQTLLVARGYDTGGVDGIFGPGTRAAVRAYQAEQGLPADGYPNAALLARLRAQD